MNNIRTKYQRIIIVITSLIFLSSLLMSDTLMNGYTASKEIGFIIVTYIAVIVFITITIINKQQWKYRWKMFDTLMIIYFVYNIISHIVIAKNRFLDQDFLCFTTLIVFYFVVRMLFEQKTIKHAIGNYLIVGLLITALIQIIVGLLQFYGLMPSFNSYFKTTGLFINPAQLAMYLAAVFPLTLGVYLFYDKNKTVYYLGLSVGIGTLLLIPSTQNRTSWVSLLVGSLVIFNYKYGLILRLKPFFERTFNKIIFFLSAAILIISLLIGLYLIKPDSAYGRLFVWEVSLDMIKEKPFLGSGYNSFHDTYTNHQSIWFKQNIDHSAYAKKVEVAGKVTTAYNEIIQLVVEKGIIGLVLITLMILVIFDKKYVNLCYENNKGPDNRTWCEIIVFGSITAVCFSGLFGYPFSILPVTSVFIFLLGILVSIQPKTKLFRWHKTYDIHLSGTISKLTSGLAIILCLVMLSHETQVIQAYKEWKQAAYYTRTKTYTKSLPYYEKAYAHLKYNGDFLQYYGNALYNTGNIDQSIAVLEMSKNSNADIYLYTLLGQCYQSKKQYKIAEIHLKHAMYMIPGMFYPKYLLAKLYEETGKSDQALAMANEIMNMKIKVNSKAINEIKSEMHELISSKKKKIIKKTEL